MTESHVVDPHKREWLKVPVEPDNRPPIKWTMRGGGQMHIANLTELEGKALEAFLNGSSWIRCIDGRLAAVSAYHQPPEPEDDPLMVGHWDQSNSTLKLTGEFPANRCGASIVISHLGAGLSTERERRANTRLAKSMGFTCLRSQRGEDGKYWETWNLFGIWMAKGILKTFCDELPKNIEFDERVQRMAHFIAVGASLSFGSLDVTVQRWALTHD